LKKDRETLIRYLLIASIVLIGGAAFALFYDKVVPQLGTILRFVGVLFFPFAIAWLVAVITRPFNRFMIGKLRLPASLAIIILLIILFISILGQILTDLAKYASHLDQYTNDISALITQIYEKLNLNYDQIMGYIEQYKERIVGWASQGINVVLSVVKATPGALILILVSLVAIFYWCRDEEKVRQVVCSILPLKYRDKAFNTYDRFSTVIGQYIRAQLILITITFIICTVGFSLIGAERPIAMGLFAGVLDVIPVLGPGTLIVPWAVWSIVSGKLGFGIALIIIYVVNTVSRYILEPKIVGDRVGLHPLAALAAIFVGLKAFGLVGLILGPITLAVIMTTIRARKPKTAASAGTDKPRGAGAITAPPEKGRKKVTDSEE